MTSDLSKLLKLSAPVFYQGTPRVYHVVAATSGSSPKELAVHAEPNPVVGFVDGKARQGWGLLIRMVSNFVPEVQDVHVRKQKSYKRMGSETTVVWGLNDLLVPVCTVLPVGPAGKKMVLEALDFALGPWLEVFKEKYGMEPVLPDLSLLLEKIEDLFEEPAAFDPMVASSKDDFKAMQEAKDALGASKKQEDPFEEAADPMDGTDNQKPFPKSPMTGSGSPDTDQGDEGPGEPNTGPDGAGTDDDTPH